MTIEEETKLALENVEWIKREQCLGCYQLVNNSEFGKYTKLDDEVTKKDEQTTENS